MTVRHPGVPEETGVINQENIQKLVPEEVAEPEHAA